MEEKRIKLTRILDFVDGDGTLYNDRRRTINTKDLQGSMSARLVLAKDPLINPLIVMEYPDKEDYYVLLAGYRRRTALRALKVREARCYIYEGDDPLVVMGVDNIHAPLSPLARAQHILHMRNVRNEKGRRTYSDKTIRVTLGINKGTLDLLLDLLDADVSVKGLVDSGKMSLSAFRRICKQSAARQKEIVEEAKERSRNDSGKVTIETIKTAKAAVEADETGEPMVGDRESVNARFNKIRKDLAEVMLMNLSQGEKIRAAYHLDRIGSEVESWRLTLMGELQGEPVTLEVEPL